MEEVSLIHAANPNSRPVGIIVFAHVVRPSVRPSPLFKSRKTKQQKTMFATGVTMGLAYWIIDDTCLVSLYFLELFHEYSHNTDDVIHSQVANGTMLVTTFPYTGKEVLCYLF